MKIYRIRTKAQSQNIQPQEDSNQGGEKEFKFTIISTLSDNQNPKNITGFVARSLTDAENQRIISRYFIKPDQSQQGGENKFKFFIVTDMPVNQDHNYITDFISKSLTNAVNQGIISNFQIKDIMGMII